MTKVFVIRHGESEKDKTNPQRGLTTIGKKQMKVLGRKILQGLVSKTVLTVTTDQKRMLESAKNFVGKKRIEVKQNPLLRVFNLKTLLPVKPPGIDLTFYYFKLYQESKLPKKITAPNKVAKLFLDEIDDKFETVVFIGHSGALEAFVNYNKIFKPKKLLERELKYGEAIQLVKRDGKLNS